MLLSLHFLVVPAHRFISNKIKIKIPSKAQSNKTDAFMGLNDNSQAPG